MEPPIPVQGGANEVFVSEGDPLLATAPTTANAKWRVGIILLGIVVVLWVASGFLVNSLFESDKYRKPYLMTYINSTAFSVYLIPYYLGVKAREDTTGDQSMIRRLSISIGAPLRRLKRALSTDMIAHKSTAVSYISANNSDVEQEQPGVVHRTTPQEFPGPIKTVSTETTLSDWEEEDTAVVIAPFSVRETALLSLQFCVLWFLANWFSNSGLIFTSVGSATVLSCTSSAWTLVIGIVAGIERLSRIKFFAVLLSLFGVVLISNFDTSYGPDTVGITASLLNGTVLLGDILELASAMFYGIYTTMLKFKVGDDSRMNMQLFFGCVGLCNALLLWPFLLALHFSGMETLELPPDARSFWLFFGNIIVTVVSDYLWVVAMLMTTPLIVTVGLTMTIPLGSLGDMIIKRHFGSPMYYVGAALICLSFFVLNKESSEEDHRH
ncbi:hypothetical protein CANCADRAFT_75767 [Tortispora caseinolytica NRRL Y-17796]|uniref:EamA domain-containing protein n=1 Tax=Tortispora caseinolytica NRRL Y-17796 TaxID=767744 RepID=A0A1E4TJ70_9ASCO|nr:hypothetical protein CANCADRAFT_75767 [Tortispora caseinolytica NRRL Y-17796]